MSLGRGGLSILISLENLEDEVQGIIVAVGRSRRMPVLAGSNDG